MNYVLYWEVYMNMYTCVRALGILFTRLSSRVHVMTPQNVLRIGIMFVSPRTAPEVLNFEPVTTAADMW